MSVSEQIVALPDVALNVASAGEGPVIVLLHGFPHTWQVWRPVIPYLAARHRVLAPDLRGLGASSRSGSGYTAGDVAADVAHLLDALDVDHADVVGLDLGAPAAVMTALEYPERVRRLVAIEGILGGLPGAEEFLADGPPWWFGFHRVPGLAEAVLAGNERCYVDFFLDTGTLGDGVRSDFREAVHEAYADEPALSVAFSHYRAMPESSRQIMSAGHRRLSMPTMAIGASAVGAATHRQLMPIADDLRGEILEDCGHIVPQHRPKELIALLGRFLG